MVCHHCGVLWGTLCSYYLQGISLLGHGIWRTGSTRLEWSKTNCQTWRQIVRSKTSSTDVVCVIGWFVQGDCRFGKDGVLILVRGWALAFHLGPPPCGIVLPSLQINDCLADTRNQYKIILDHSGRKSRRKTILARHATLLHGCHD